MARPVAPQALAQLEETLAAGGAGDAFALLADAMPNNAGEDRITRGLAAARTVYAQGFPRVAIAAVREAWRQAPGRSDAAFRLCAMLITSRHAEGKAVLDRCLAVFPGPADGWVEIGEALLAVGQKAAALVCLARGQSSAALSIRRGLLARDIDARTEARRCFEDAVRRDPASARGWFLLGTAAEDVGDLEAAATAYGTAVAIDPRLAEAAVNLGIVLQARGRLEEAKVAYASAVRTRPATFARIAQALPGASTGELWLDVTALRRSLAG